MRTLQALICPRCRPPALPGHRRADTRVFRACPFSRCSSTTTSASRPSPPPLKLAIIGAGPSGFYTASRILSSLPPDSPSGQGVKVHMYERLPTPYGLVRYGVAPDHPEVKNCQHKFDDLSLDPRFRFFGNTLIGSPPTSTLSSPTPSTTLSTYTYPHALPLPLSALLPHYTALLLSYGASLSNPLSSVTGSSSSPRPLRNVFPALAFVSWYNGHPAFSALPVDLRNVQDVTIVGQGNVALDVARVLLKSVDELRKTDVPESVLEVLAESKVKRVRVVGRRGSGQVAFTTKEFREMVNLPDVAHAGLAGVGEELITDARAAVEGDRMRKRLLGLMEKGNGVTGPKEFALEFLRSPTAFLPSNPSSASSTTSTTTSTSSSADKQDSVGAVRWTLNELLPSPPPAPSPPPSQAEAVSASSSSSSASQPVMARATGEIITTPADIVIESVGYRSEPLLGDGWEVPFDVARGRVRNVGGRAVDASGMAMPGIYAAGWAARGPVGVIASTMHDAYSLAAVVLEDHYGASTSGPASGSGGARLTSAGLAPLVATLEPGIPQEISRGLREGNVVDLARWSRIDAAERERGRALGKKREKFTNVGEMLAVG